MESPGLSSSSQLKEIPLLKLHCTAWLINILPVLVFSVFAPSRRGKTTTFPKKNHKTYTQHPNKHRHTHICHQKKQLWDVVKTPMGEKGLFLFSTRLISVSLIASRAFWCSDKGTSAPLETLNPIPLQTLQGLSVACTEDYRKIIVGQRSDKCFTAADRVENTFWHLQKGLTLWL